MTKIELLGEVMVLWGQIRPKMVRSMGTVWVVKKAFLSQTSIHIIGGPVGACIRPSYKEQVEGERQEWEFELEHAIVQTTSTRFTSVR